jgi:hypothetical protein
MKKCYTVTLPVVLYGRKTSSFALREEYMLTIFENRALRRILGPKRDGIRNTRIEKLHNEELHNVYSSTKN